jgi:hypothetical protein
MNDNVGSIAYDARIETANFSKDAALVEARAGQVASSVETSGNRGFTNFASQASSSFDSVATGLARVLRGATLVGTAGAIGIGAAAKASWDQVSAVQQSTVALSAYEKDTGKVNKTLSELVGYARSDLGVLFNRKDLFQSAQSLKIMGDSTENLTGHVKILSRSVGLGLSNWTDLNQIVGRVGSTGRLTGDDFDNLTKAGYRLDPALRNTNITFDKLFQALDKGIPADALAGQANTITGLGVRLQTAFRGIGDAILGVNSDTGNFVEGGLGSKLVSLMGQLTTLMKDPTIKNSFREIGASIGDFATKALPLVISGFTWIVNNMGTVTAAFGGLIAAYTAAKIAAIGFSIAASANPIGLIAAAIVALIGVLTFLQIKFDIFGKAWQALQPIVQPVIDMFGFLFNILGQQLAPAIDFVSRNMDIFKTIGLVLLALVLVPTIVVIGSMVAALAIVVGAVIAVINIFQTWYRVGQDVVSFFASLPRRILGAIGNVGSLLYNVGKDIVQGLINGIKDAIGEAVGAVSGAANAVKNTFKSILGIHSPSTVFAMYGKNIVQGLSVGIDRNSGIAQSSVSNMLGGYSASIPFSGSLSAIDSAASANNSTNTTQVEVNLSGIMTRSKADEREVARSLVQRLNDELAAKNVELIGNGAL